MTEGASPLDLVVRILNNQLTSLLWIDEKVLDGLSPFAVASLIVFSAET